VSVQQLLTGVLNSEALKGLSNRPATNVSQSTSSSNVSVNPVIAVSTGGPISASPNGYASGGASADAQLDYSTPNRMPIAGASSYPDYGRAAYQPAPGLEGADPLDIPVWLIVAGVALAGWFLTRKGA
jgi:hypothetical protein